MITPSTALSYLPPWDISQLVNDIARDADATNPATGNFDGFVTPGCGGIIQLALDKDYELTGFLLSNDVNVGAEGVSTFLLRYFDSAGNLISTSQTYSAPAGYRTPNKYTFTTVPAVRRVDMEVLSCQASLNRIEIREVEFVGSPSTSSVAT